jgi:hypothetical protein
VNAAPASPASSPPPLCVWCGYDLTGIGEGRTVARCPECGAKFDPRNPGVLRPWPDRRRLLLKLCGPFWLVLLIPLQPCIIMAPIGLAHLRPFELPDALFGPGMFLLLIMLAFAYLPAQDMALWHAPRPDRRKETARLTALALAVNIPLTLAFFMILAGIAASLR